MVFSTQEAISIAGIKDGVIIMKDGGYRLVLQVAATNFALKSEQEQNSIIFQYQSFLNSLHFPIEIVISSRRLDLSPYISKIEKTTENQPSELMKTQVADYVDFLKKLIDLANIMKKTFYVVISYQPMTIKKTGFFDSLLGKKSLIDHIQVSEEDFKKNCEKLREQATTVATGLGSMGLHCFQLTTEQLIELFYLYFNPDEATKEVVKDITQLASSVVMGEDEFQNNGQVATKTEAENQNMIDNTGVVQAKQRQESVEKSQANAAAQPTNNGQPAPAAPTNNSATPTPQPANQQPVAQNQPQTTSAEAATGNVSGQTSQSQQTAPTNQATPNNQ